MEILLDGEKEKVKNLEGTMSEGEKALRKKCQILEHNLEQITGMYHQISSQKTLQALDNQVKKKF